MDKQNVMYPYNEALFDHKNEWITSFTWNYFLRHGGTSETVKEVKEARHEGPYIVSFHLYNMSRKGKSIEKEGLYSRPGLE